VILRLTNIVIMGVLSQIGLSSMIQTIVDIEGRDTTASKPAETERIEGARGYAGDYAAWVTEDETILEASR
jgi:hypothetical protein